MSQRVLIIDDEENIRRMMRLTLEAAGYEVGEAGDGQQGLDLYAGGSHWDLVLLDQRMPGMDGLEVLRRLERREAAVRVVMITAYASVELAVEAMKLGASDFVRKPMTPEMLRGAVAAAISKSVDQTRKPDEEREPGRQRPQIETVTLNGFEIIPPSDADAIKTQLDEHAFVVRSPDGERSSVIIKIDEEALGYVERLAHRSLSPDNSFWLSVAEHLLSDYLWNEGKIPPGGKLTLKQINREQLLIAERWKR